MALSDLLQGCSNNSDTDYPGRQRFFTARNEDNNGSIVILIMSGEEPLAPRVDTDMIQ